tara:strand:- start:15425 stop:15580 length:156 start_codon:yes stop_codon:yes gene_type:complete
MVLSKKNYDNSFINHLNKDILNVFRMRLYKKSIRRGIQDKNLLYLELNPQL